MLLLIFDGFGIAPAGPGNALETAAPPVYKALLQNAPWIPLKASGAAVGLPPGNAGNSEVGHLTLGAGRVLYQDLPKINNAIQNGSFFSNPVFLQAVQHAQKTGGTLHLMGLISDGGVHAHQKHLFALIDFAKRQGVKNVRVHAFLDGRDTPPKSAEKYLRQLETKLQQTGYPPVATISGRYYAMDRDNRWERTEKAYDTLASGAGKNQLSSLKALQENYRNNITDEFIEPTVTDPTYRGMQDGDSMLVFNYRPDRARQITRALTDSTFTGFSRGKVLQNTYTGCMTPYDETLNLPVAFPKDKTDNTLSDVLSKNGLKQFRTAETEKYAHVTYFFNGGLETPHAGEVRKLVPSPKVATYDLKPEMSVQEVTNEVIGALKSNQYDFIVANFANTDMVGHTGNNAAAVASVKAVDTQLGRIVQTVLSENDTMLLTADHGKVEKMLDKKGTPFTAHTTNPVPLVLVSNDKSLTLDKSRQYGLSNVAPTILDWFGIAKPAEMTANSVLKRVQNVVRFGRLFQLENPG